MKKKQMIFTLMALMVLTFALAGCPKSDKMMGDAAPRVNVTHVG